jgi:hypothetical protein
LERLHEEVAFIAVGLGWSYNEILSLTHRERAQWVQQINRINTRYNREVSKQMKGTYGGPEAQ